MKYKGKELKGFRSDENIAFNPPKTMLVWDDNNGGLCHKTKVFAYTPALGRPVITWTGTPFRFCAEIPKAKTNWEAFAEAQEIEVGTKEAVAKFIRTLNIAACFICPAKKFCKAHDIECQEAFNEWANAPSEEDDT